MARNVSLCLSILPRAGYWTVEFKHNVFCVLQTLPSEFLCNHKNLYCQTKNCLIARQRSSPDQIFWSSWLLGLRFQVRAMKNLNRLQYLVILQIMYMYLYSCDAWDASTLWSRVQCRKLKAADDVKQSCRKVCGCAQRQNSSTYRSLEVTALPLLPGLLI